MLELIRYDLQDPCEWKHFCGLFSSYLAEVCDEEEYQENIDDLHDETLNRQMIEQTLQRHNPYFVMKIVRNGKCVGIISYSYNEDRHDGFINNFYICPEHRNEGVGSSVYRMVEAQLTSLGAMRVALVPVETARHFYVRNGFAPTGRNADGEQIYCKMIVSCGNCEINPIPKGCISVGAALRRWPGNHRHGEMAGAGALSRKNRQPEWR